MRLLLACAATLAVTTSAFSATSLQVTESAQTTDELPTPAWWKGREVDLETALEQASAWARDWSGSGAKRRAAAAWTTQDGSWGVGAAVVPEPNEIRSKEDVLEDLSLLAEARALLGIAVASTEDEILTALALTDSPMGSGVDASMKGDFRTRDYADGERLFVISLISLDDLKSLSIRGEGTAQFNSFAAHGAITLGERRELAAGAAVSTALSLSTARGLISRAADLAIDQEDPRAAELVMQAAAAQVLDVEDKACARIGSLSRLIPKGPELPRLLSREDSLADRLDVIARFIREMEMGEMPLLLSEGGERVTLMALNSPSSTTIEVRDSVAMFRADGGGVRVPRLALSWTGDLMKASPVQGSAANPGASLLIDSGGAEWLFARAAETLDPRLVASGPRVRITGLPADTPDREVAALASRGRAADLDLWRSLSCGAIDEVSSTDAVHECVVWTSRTEEGHFEVDFTPEIDSVLQKARRMASFSASILAEGEGALLLADAAESLEAIGADSNDSRGQDLRVRLSLKRGETVRGVEEGSILTGPKPWVQVPLELEVVLRCGDKSRKLSKKGSSKRVFGGHDTQPAVLRAASSLFGGISQNLERDAFWCLTESTKVRVIGPECPALASIEAVGSARFGPVTRLVKAGSSEGAIELGWPGGVRGLRQTLESLAGFEDWADAHELNIESVD